MSARKRTFVIVAVVGLASSSLFGIAGAGAAKAPGITGSIRCTMNHPVQGDPQLRFSPDLMSKDHVSGASAGRGNSAVTLLSGLEDCTSVSGGPAPAGIVSGFLTGTGGKVKYSYCEKLGKLKFKATITWRNASNAVVGTTALNIKNEFVRRALSEQPLNIGTGKVKGSSPIFAKNRASYSLVVSASLSYLNSNCKNTSGGTLNHIFYPTFFLRA